MRRFAPPASRTVFVRLLMGTCLAAALAVTTIQAQIPGRNINMVSGSTWPDGDPFLQRQNEPSIAASTRNPLHLLAGANDYRTVDLPGLPGDETGDAWLGLFKSFDGGQRWTSTLLPGYPQDRSPEGLASPIRGYAAGADPVVRAGTNGLIYYAGLVFDRSPAGSDIPGKSAIFVSRFIDNNNKEAGDPFAYLGTRALATDPGGATGNFLDKPWLAVDIPRDATRCTITTPSENNTTITQNLPAGPLYVAYTLRSTDKQGARYDVYFTRSTDCGNTWTMPMRLNNQSERANQGATMAIDPRNGNVYIAWRQFDLTGDNDAVMSVTYTATSKKIDPPGFAHKFGKNKAQGKGKGLNPEHFYKKGGVNKAIEAAQLSPLDQATSDIAGLLAFRTNAYPSLTVDGAGRVYMAWAERGYEPLAPDPLTGNARILVSSSADGKAWTTPQAVAAEGQGGHQLMPTITFAGGKLMLVYYDLRETRSEVLFSRFIDDVTALAGTKQRRHTIDLRASMASPGAAPAFAPSVRVSDYMMGAGRDGVRRQLQVNPPNLPMFRQGTAPFMGDYVDVTAAPNFVVDATGKWIYNTAPAASLPVFHAVWTDNRDVRPPLEDPDNDGNPWNNFIPAGTTVGAASLVDPTKIFLNSCIPGNAGSRNQNIYTARITGGILAGSPGNSKQLGYRLDQNGQPTSELMQRAFVVFVQNTASPAPNTTATKTFRLTITGQPVGGRASFDQFSAAPLAVIDTAVPARSTSSRTVYVTSTDPDARINITVTEVASIGGAPVTGGLGSVVVLNPDIDNPDIDNPDIDNPDIDNPDIDNVEVYNPDIDNPDIDNPDIDNPDIDNPDIDNPDIDNVVIANPDIDNPDIDNPDIDNPDIDNPDIDNPDIDNPDIDNASLTDVSWSITNTGNTSASYNVNLFFAQTTIKPELTTQLILYRTYRTPIVVNCELKYETRNMLVSNVPNPQLVKSSTGSVSDPNDPEATNATIWLAPGESAKITLRIYDTNKHDNELVTITNADGTTTTARIDPSLVPNQNVTPVVQQQGVNTEDVDAGITEPPIVVQFPAPQTVPDAASTAPNTPVTFNVLANDSTAFGSTKVISLHPANMASHSGGGPGDLAFQSSTGFLYTQRGIIDPATDVLVGRLPLPPPGTSGIVYQQANHRTGINYGRTAQVGGGLSALDARPGSPTFHQYLPMPAIPDTVFSFGIDATHRRLYVIHGPNASPTTTTLSVVDINPANQPGTFHTVLSSVAIPGNARGQAVAVNTRTQKVYVTASNFAGGVYVFDGTQQPLQPAVKVAGTLGAWSVVVNEAANVISASTQVGANLFGLYVIDGATNALATIPTPFLARTNNAEERLALHIPSGRVLMRLETEVVIIDTQRGSPTRNTVVGQVTVGRENGGVDIVVDQELGLAVTAGSFDFRADIIDIEAGALTETIALKAGSTDVAIDPINHRAFVAVPLTYVQEIDLLQQEATSAVPVFIESGGVLVNPVTNKVYSGILTVGGKVGVFSGAGFDGFAVEDGSRDEARFLFGTRYDATNRYFIVNQGSPDGTSYGPGTVIAIDGGSDEITSKVETRANPFGIGVNQATGKLYVSTLSAPGAHGGFDVFDANNIESAPAQATLAAGFPLNSTNLNAAFLGFGRHVVVNASAAHPNAGKVYAMQIGSSPTSLVVIDPLTNIITPLDGLTTALPGGLPAGAPLAAPGTGANGLWGRVEVVRAAPALNRVYLGMYDSLTNTNRIVALDGTTDQVIGSWIGGRHSNRHTASYLIVNEATNRLYVTNFTNNTLTMLDATTLLPVATPAAPAGVITLPAGPSAQAFNVTSNRLYVSSIAAKMLTAIDGATLAVLSSVKMPLVAQFLGVDEIESRIYTSGGDSGDESGIMVITDVLGQLGTNVSVTSITQPDFGTAVLNPDFSVTYTPTAVSPTGTDTFGYTVTAPTGTANGVVNITVVSTDPRSVAFVDGYNTQVNQLLTVAAPGLLANDATGDPTATVVVNDTTAHGDLTWQANGSFTYQPDPGFVGMDEFEYHTAGLLGPSNTTKVGIIVTAATSLVVTTTADSGSGSLRLAMSTANLEPGSVITFNIPDETFGPGPHTIQPTSGLPTMTAPVTIDGYTQPGAVPNSLTDGTNAQLKIILRGPAGGNGLNLRGGNSTVRGLVINGFTSGSGILLDGPLGNNTVEGNFIGTDVTGTSAAANQYGVSSQSPNNLIGGTSLASRNLISGNNNQGARALAGTSGSGASTVVLSTGSGTAFRNNLIGTAASGMTALPNGGGISLSVPGVAIGGTSAAERNIISGNTGQGINAFANVSNGFVVTVPAGLTVQGNYIGTTVTGLAALANTGGGISASGNSTTIGGANASPGGACTGACNLISGNSGTGLTLSTNFNLDPLSPSAGAIHSSAVNSVVAGNYIGVNVNGTGALGNSSSGIFLSAQDVQVGGGSAATRNVIGGNGLATNGAGIFAGSNALNNLTDGTSVVVTRAIGAVIRGNYLGLNAAGTAALANANGIYVSVPDVTIGGIVAGDRNVISGNINSGINTFANTFTPGGAFPVVVSTTPARLIVKGNYIGVTADGATALANTSNGLWITGENSVIGGTENTSALSCTGACNLISGNTNGSNNASGLGVTSHFNNTPGPGLGDLYSSASGTQILGNFVGVNLSGTAAIANSSGMYINAANVIVGGPAAGARNVVAGNTGSGISIGTSYVSTNTPVASGTGTRITGNIVGLTVDGTLRLANGQCGICSYTGGVIIGGPGLNEGNRVVGGTSSNGINLGRQTNGTFLVDAGGTTTVEGNIIGLSTTNARLNGGTGIDISSAGNQIVGNIVAGNGSTVPLVFGGGIRISGAFANLNSVRGNTIGTNLAGAAGLGNNSSGVMIRGGSNNTIGGVNPGDRNVIVGNAANGGVEFYAFSGDVMTGNQVLGNYIGVLPSGTAIPNQTGIRIYANPPSGPNPAGIVTGSTIGGIDPAARNIISGNTGDGINMGGGGTTNNTIAGNYIGTTIDGLMPLPNTGSGISLSEGGGNTVGGTAAGAGNLIAFNNSRGVSVFSNSTGNRILGNTIRGNGNLAIDLNGDGASANDNGDADTGGNNRQNYPALVSAANSGGTTGVQADLSSFAAGQYTLQFFASAACDANGNSRAERLAGTFEDVNGSGTQTFQLTPPLAAGEYVTATATDSNGNTSELSPCLVQADVVPTAVTNTNNGGSGSLRQALIYSNATPGTQTITFNIPGAGPHTIQPTSMLPVISAPTVIDGYTQPHTTPNTLPPGAGTNADLRIVINGANATGAWAGLSVGSGGATIRGLVINGFTGQGAAGILLDNPTGTSVVAGNFLGTDATGMVAVPNGWGVVTHSPNSVIGGSAPADRNLLSGNNQSGAQVSAATNNATVFYTASGSSVRNNLMGTNATGNVALPNQKSGIEVSVPGVSIGSADAADRNVVSGNLQTGISAYAWTFANAPVTIPTGLRIEGNYIGTSVNGMAAVPNGGGIAVNGAFPIIGGTAGTTPGGACTGACNLISGNNGSGVVIQNQFDFVNGTHYSSATNATVQGNYVGVNVLGTSNLPNIGSGIDVSAASSTIGGNTPSARNVVSGNNGPGISLFANFTSANTPVGSANGTILRGNYIGLTATGTVLASNGSCGICASVTGITIGGANPGDGNFVAGNSTAINLGQQMNGLTTIDGGGNSTVQGNTIGLSSAGVRLNATGTGIYVASGGNQVRQNTVAGNGTPVFGVTGISLNGLNAIGNFVRGNFVGTTTTGEAGLGNSGTGILVNDSASNTIGGTIPADRNVIVGNGGGGVSIYTSPTGSANNNVVLGNYIGLNPDGLTPNANGNHGITVSPANGGTVAGTVIGGSAPGSGNVVSSNSGNGIALYGAVSTTSISGNLVGVAANGTSDRGNSAAGVWISDAANNTVGGANPGDANTIAFNDQTGVGVQGPTATGNRIWGNRIFGNGGNGIDLNFGGNNNQGAPVLSSAANAGPTTTVNADLISLFPGSYTVEFFASTTCNGGNRQGERLIGRFPGVVTGPATTHTLTELVPTGEFITATATDLNGNTSGFSACAQVTTDPLMVTNTSDSGAGSLRSAITHANATPGAQTVTFNIPGVSSGSPGVIDLASSLPAITGPVTIDGTTQPGYTNAPAIELNGLGAPGNGLRVQAANVTVRALAIGGFSGRGISLGADNFLLTGSYIGVRPDGVTGRPNTIAGIHVVGNNNTIGGTTPNLRNVISANGGSGIYVQSYNRIGNVILGNYIGLNAAGTAALGNVGSGITLDQSNTVTMGGGAAGAMNVISGNGQHGVDVYICDVTFYTCNGHLIEGNRIGTNSDGTAAIANAQHGIKIEWAPNNIIKNNLISGNALDGVNIWGTSAAHGNQLVVGNLIGTTRTGNAALGNQGDGVQFIGIIGIASRIGGPNVQDRNVIAWNAGTGVYINGAHDSFVQGNYIGVPASGDGVAGNGGTGVTMDSNSINVTLGGATPNLGNVISNNGSGGVTLWASVHDHLIRNNIVGWDASGTVARGNTGNGIRLDAYNNVIQENQIGNSTLAGVSVVNGAGNKLSANRITNNGTMGIDLGNNANIGPDINDPGDGDSGPNNLQNYPVLTSVSSNGNDTTVVGALNSTPNSSFTMEFFLNSTADTNGYGEGAQYLAALPANTDGSGNFNFSATMPNIVTSPGQWVSATATNTATGDTSEFSVSSQVVTSDPLTVTSANDSGSGSLRAAITYANTTPGTQTISFNIPGVSALNPATIALSSPLPVITDPVTVDAISQPGYDNTPVIELSGQNTVGNGFETATDVTGVTIRGFAITRFTNAGVLLLQSDTAPGSYTVSKNFIGVSRSGAVGTGNLTGILTRGDFSYIFSNVISGNSGAGIVVENDADSVTIQQNTIGMLADGLTRRGNATGIVAYGSLNDLAITDNMISANTGWGIDLQASASQVTGTQIRRNVIGLDQNVADAGNGINNPPGGGGGIRVHSAPGTVIGGPGLRNIISGNGGPDPSDVGVGISIHGSVLPMPIIQSNFIGTDPSGVQARPNVNKGILLDGPAIVGGDQLFQGNLISGHAGVGAGGAGIMVMAGGSGSVIRGNTIGLAADGSPLGNEYSGITVFTNVTGVTIGGTTAGARNAIAGNGSFGISFPVGPTSGSIIEGNYIGTDASGTPKPNGVGVHISGGTNHRIGGDTASAANRIRSNTGSGVVITGASSGVRVLFNEIEANGGLGIDLGGNAVTGNDPQDLDTGPNNLQNHPTLTSAVKTGPNSLEVDANLVDFAPGTYTFEFFAQPFCDTSGHGEGLSHLGRTTLFVPGGTTQLFPLSAAVAAGWQVTGTATDALGNTSEFSACTPVTSNATITSATPPTIAVGGGQMIWLNGTNLPGTGPADIIIKSGGIDYPAQYTWTAGSNLVVARFTAAILPGPATIRVKHPSGSPASNEFNITISATPSAPIATGVYGGSCGGFGGPASITATTQGGGVVVGAKGIDTTGVKFKWTPLNGGGSQSVVAGSACGGPNDDVHVQSTVPLAYGPGTVLQLAITTTVNGVESVVSNSFTLTVEDAATLGGSVSSGADPAFPAMNTQVGFATTRLTGNYNGGGISLIAAHASPLEYPMGTTGEYQYGAAGFAGTDTAFVMTCGPGGVITGLKGQHSSANAINNLGIDCKAPNALGGPVTSSDGHVGPNGVTSFTLSCPAGTKMVGFQGQAGGHISGLGIVCR